MDKMYKKRRYLLPYQTKIKIGKFINGTLAAIMLLTLLFPAGFAQAAETGTHTIRGNAAERCAAPDRNTGSDGSIFLPFILNLFNGLRVQTGEFASESASLINPTSHGTDQALLNAHHSWSPRQVSRQLAYEVGKSYVYLYDFTPRNRKISGAHIPTEQKRPKGSLCDSIAMST